MIFGSTECPHFLLEGYHSINVCKYLFQDSHKQPQAISDYGSIGVGQQTEYD